VSTVVSIDDSGFALRHPERLLTIVHEPGPVKVDEIPYARDCVGCTEKAGRPVAWPCAAELRRRTREEGEARVEREHTRRKRAEVSREGLLALVEPGCSIYSAEGRRMTAGGEVAIGGVIVEEAQDVDRETGDMEKWWTVLDPVGERVTVRVVRESEIKAAGVDSTSPSTMARLIFRLAAEIADAGRGKDRRLTRTHIDTKVLDRCRWMLTLAKLMTGGA
jgi:hypothetical protein